MSKFRFRVYLFKPLIPQNTGNIGRLCVGHESQLTILGEPAFNLDDKSLRRAGLDYWPKLDFSHIYDEKAWIPPKRCFKVSKFAKKSIFDMRFQEGDSFLFGQETKGLEALDPEVLEQVEGFSLPMNPDIRSFNLANSVAMVLIEATRQLFFSNRDQ